MPAAPRLRSAGTFVLGLLVLGTGCEQSERDADASPRVLELDSTRVTLPDSVRLVVVELDRSTSADLAPREVSVRVGDIVRFQALDASAHAVAFEGAGLTPEARRFLEVTGQMRSPPLLAQGNAWVVSFANAPPGEYPFRCVTHGGSGHISLHER